MILNTLIGLSLLLYVLYKAYDLYRTVSFQHNYNKSLTVLLKTFFLSFKKEETFSLEDIEKETLVSINFIHEFDDFNISEKNIKKLEELNYYWWYKTSLFLWGIIFFISIFIIAYIWDIYNSTIIELIALIPSILVGIIWFQIAISIPKKRKIYNSLIQYLKNINWFKKWLIDNLISLLESIKTDKLSLDINPIEISIVRQKTLELIKMVEDYNNMVLDISKDNILYAFSKNKALLQNIFFIKFYEQRLILFINKKISYHIASWIEQHKKDLVRLWNNIEKESSLSNSIELKGVLELQETRLKSYIENIKI